MRDLGVRVTHYSPNEEWELKLASITKSDYEHDGTVVSRLLLVVQVKRKPLFYFVTLVLPSYIMCALSIVSGVLRLITIIYRTLHTGRTLCALFDDDRTTRTVHTWCNGHIDDGCVVVGRFRKGTTQLGRCTITR